MGDIRIIFFQVDRQRRFVFVNHAQQVGRFIDALQALFKFADGKIRFVQGCARGHGQIHAELFRVLLLRRCVNALRQTDAERNEKNRQCPADRGRLMTQGGFEHDAVNPHDGGPRIDPPE